MKHRILATEEFEEWLENEPAKSRVQIAKRIEKIKEEGYFGDHKKVIPLIRNKFELCCVSSATNFWSSLAPCLPAMVARSRHKNLCSFLAQLKLISDKWYKRSCLGASVGEWAQNLLLFDPSKSSIVTFMRE